MNLNQLREEEYALFPSIIRPSHLAKRTKLTTKAGVQKLVELDRYSLRDNTLQTLKEGDVIIAELIPDPKFPVQGYGRVNTIDRENGTLTMTVEYPEVLMDKNNNPLDVDLNNFERPLTKVIKPLEVYWEQIVYRVARGTASVEKSRGLRRYWFKKFFNELKAYNGIPGGRILYGAGSGNNVTLFNCFSGDTPVQTLHGMLKIKGLRGTIHVLSQDGVYRPAVFKSYGEQELYQVEFSNGELIKATAGHEWVVTKPGGGRTKVTTLDLEGRKVPLVPNRKPLENYNREELLEGIRHGIYYGDGSIVDNKFGHVLLFGEKRELSKYFETEDYKITPHYKDDYLGVYGIDISWKQPPTEDKSEAYWVGFIQGLIATDGCVDTRGSVMFHSSNLEDLVYISENIKKTGILYTSITEARAFSPFDGEFKPNYKFQIVKNSIIVEDLLKTSHREKFSNSVKSTKTQTLTVLSVTPLNITEEVFCCEEPETNTFVVGSGILTGNCFVLPAIPDSRKGINDHRGTTMEIMSRGGGVGSNGSALRPKDEIVVGVNGKSSGSVSWLDDLSKLTDLVQQGGSRRGAQMIGLADWHPDLIYFMMCKIQNPHVLHKIAIESHNQTIAATAESLLIRDDKGAPVGVRDTNFMTGANISVLISDDFMKQVEANGEWSLRFPDIDKLTPEQKEFYDNHWHEMADVRKWEELGYPTKVYETFKSQDLWDLINVAARFSAEPGIIFIDTCNNESNCWYYSPLVVTNPCGEQPLPPYAVCNLFAINLANFYDAHSGKIAYPKLRRTVRVAHRFADNIIDHSFYFLDENEHMAKAERRIGLGVMGLADLLIMLKQAYGSEESLETIDELFAFIRDEAYLSSADLAEEKGSFPLFDAEKYLQSGFNQRLPQHIQDAIRIKGKRNVCDLTVAPTGSTGTMVGVSTGLEPYFAFKYYRSGRLGKFIEVNTDIAQAFFDANPEATELPDYYVASNDLPALLHVKVQSTIQKYIDSAISKTANAPSTFTVEDNKELYLEAWRTGCKGVTVYVDGSRDSQVLNLTKDDNEFESLDETVIDTAEGVADEKELILFAPSESDSSLDTDDTRACQIRFENGQMIKEC